MLPLNFPSSLYVLTIKMDLVFSSVFHTQALWLPPQLSLNNLNSNIKMEYISFPLQLYLASQLDLESCLSLSIAFTSDLRI